MGADLLNSLLYLAEGETGEAVKSLVFVFVPGRRSFGKLRS